MLTQIWGLIKLIATRVGSFWNILGNANNNRAARNAISLAIFAFLGFYAHQNNINPADFIKALPLLQVADKPKPTADNVAPINVRTPNPETIHKTEKIPLKHRETKSSDHEQPWDRISDHEWSNKYLSHFYSYVESSNEQALRAAALAGNNNARLLLSIGIHHGIIPPSPQYQKKYHREEIPYLESACTSGLGRACALLAYHYSRIMWHITKPSPDAESMLYRRGCALDNHISCFFGGGLHPTLLTRGPFNQEAFNLLNEKCESGIGYACYLAGQTYVAQNDHPNIKVANRYFQRGCQLSFDYSCRRSAVVKKEN